MKRIKKPLAFVLSVMLIMSSLAGCGNVQAAVDTTIVNEEMTEAETVESKLVHSDNKGKEETVYVVADASGRPQKTIVSAWLKNGDGAAVIKDYAALSDIENVKGNEAYRENADGSIEWQADGRDIYYQGQSEAELPVSVSITYELDGKEVTAEQLDGAEGHLVMTFHYVNHTGEQKTVDGRKVTMYQPFTVVSGVMLDNSKASNIEVTNGRVINSGDKSTVVGLAMPGLKESLGLDDMKNDIDIPESVTIEADIADFSLLTTVTLMENTLLDEVNLDEADTLDELKDAMDEMTDAFGQLLDGTKELKNGVQELNDGAGELNDGAKALDDGAGQLDCGADALISGTTEVDKGAGQLAEGASALTGGTKQLKTGINILTDSMMNLSAGADSIDSNTGMLAASASQLSQGAAGLSDGAASLAGKASEISKGADSLKDAVSVLEDLATKDNVKLAENALSSAIASLEEAKDNGVDVGSSLHQMKALLAMVDTCGGSACDAVNGIADGAEALAAGAAGLSDGAASLSDKADVLAKGSGALAQGVKVLSGGASQLADGTKQMKDNMPALQNGSQQVDEGAGELAAGAAVLKDGTQQLTVGASGLKEGTTSLKSGTTQLKDGTADLMDGVSQLLEGAGELMDGMDEFDKEAVQKLAELFEDDAEDFIDRLKALQDYAGEYRSFSGDKKDANTSVRFIMRTDSIGEQK